MVVDQLDETLGETEVDRLFHALADATRRDIVVQAAAGDRSVSALARHYPVSVTAIQKHVGVLESAGLVRKVRRGREQIVTTDHHALTVAHHVLDRLEQQWRERLGRFGDVLAQHTDRPEPAELPKPAEPPDPSELPDRHQPARPRGDLT